MKKGLPAFWPFFLRALAIMMSPEILLKAYRLMCVAKSMASIYENNRSICKYVHAVSRGHEAIQLASGFQLLPTDYACPYYRDESMLLALGFSPYELMLQLLAKRDDPFSGGREYYAHPSYRGKERPTIIHQSSSTGMQAIPATGIAQGIRFLEQSGHSFPQGNQGQPPPLVLCSMGDASLTEGEVSEALQFAVLKKLPIVYLVQDNGWGISVTAGEARAMDGYDYAAGFPGLERIKIDGSDFEQSYRCMQQVFEQVRSRRTPFLVQAKVPLLGHHTSGVRMESYRSREDLEKHQADDPVSKLKARLLASGMDESYLEQLSKEAEAYAKEQFIRATQAPEPDPKAVGDHIFVATPVTQEKGERSPAGAPKIILVDAALFAIREIMEDFPLAIVYGQDVGRRLGGVFRETATLAEQFGDERVFNTAIQEAYILGSTAGLSAVGIKPIVEVQFADYLYPGINQLVSEIAKSCYLTQGKFNIQTLIRVPVGAYGGGGPYHSCSIESTLLSIKGIKVVFPSNAADMKGLMKAAFLDPNPVVMLEHKGLYWSKVPGTEEAKTPEPSRDYILPLGIANRVLEADAGKIQAGQTCTIITYGMGVYWAKAAARSFPGQVEIIDLRSLEPLDEKMIFESVMAHGRCLVLTEEQQRNSFAEALAGRISRVCFSGLDAPVQVMGSLDLPAVPMNILLERAMLPSPEKVAALLSELLSY
jgi:2-oxoisovalerate dehydrogenase E1 component